MFAFSNEYKITKPETSSITDAIEITKIWKAQIYQNMNSHLNCWKAKDVVAEGKERFFRKSGIRQHRVY